MRNMFVVTFIEKVAHSGVLVSVSFPRVGQSQCRVIGLRLRRLRGILRTQGDGVVRVDWPGKMFVE